MQSITKIENKHNRILNMPCLFASDTHRRCPWIYDFGGWGEGSGEVDSIPNSGKTLVTIDICI